MIHIVGAGLGGLALAQGLAQRGLKHRVYERDPDARGRSQGYRISLSELGLVALQALLPPQRYARLLELECRNVGRGFAFASAPERALIRIRAQARIMCRPLLRDLLLEDVPVAWNTPIRTLDDLPGSGLVVVADGAKSNLRAALAESGSTTPELIDTGVRTIGGLVPRSPEWDVRIPLNQQGAVQYFGPRGQALFVSFCERDDRSAWILWALSQHGAFPEPDPGWHPTLRALMESGHRVPERLAIRSMRLARLAGRFHPCATLLGDAAHAMPPQRGLGGNHAIEDARMLVDNLGDIERYERDVYRRGREAIASSEEALRLLHFRHPAARALRRLALRAASIFGGPH
jgi:2-polyprenyl-6-methoxyphenol hydroxylase-like FAD-dependent oxidoreductase